MKYKNLIKITAAIASITGVIVGIGFGCGLAFQPVGEYKQASVGISGIDLGGGSNTVVVKPGTLTVMIPRYTNTYNSLLSQLQVTTPSTATRQELARRLGGFSESGESHTLNASYTLAATSLGSAVCLDRVTLEQGQAVEQRLFFNNVNLVGNSTLLTDDILNDVINRLARASWGRNQTAAEGAALLAGVKESMALDTLNNAVETREAMLYLCTAIVASVSGYQL